MSKFLEDNQKVIEMNTNARLDKMLWLCEVLALDLKMIVELKQLNDERVDRILAKYAEKQEALNSSFGFQ